MGPEKPLVILSASLSSSSSSSFFPWSVSTGSLGSSWLLLLTTLSTSSRVCHVPKRSMTAIAETAKAYHASSCKSMCDKLFSLVLMTRNVGGRWTGWHVVAEWVDHELPLAAKRGKNNRHLVTSYRLLNMYREVRRI